ncbi:MAG TPA: hypothetical protein VFW16_06370 [Streptosporangiaceae bacterium]|nr:hypothetical protein [Streptosporangiaceae bacterium]
MPQPPNALFAEMLRAARELLAVRSPLDAELMVSELLGTWWRQQPTRTGRNGRAPARRAADVEELVGEGLVGYAAEQGSPAALALLSGIACLGTPRQAIKAERAALELMEQGVARPGWAERAGAVVAADCYVNTDAFGDRDEVVCVFSYAGRDEHALVVIVDYNAGGMITDGWVTSQVGKLLDYCQNLSEPDGPHSKFGRVDAPDARRLLESALIVTQTISEPPVSKSFPSYHAFIRARIRTLPPAQVAAPARTPAAVGSLATATPPTRQAPTRRAPTQAEPRHRPEADHGAVSRRGNGAGRALSAGPGLIGPGACRRTSWRRDRRAMLVAEFLASDEAEDLSDIKAASRCADHVVDYGCDHDFGRPLRVSPAKAETFLLDWLPRKVMLTPAEQHAMPHVLVAWARWAGAKSGLDAVAIGKTLDAVFDAMPAFIRVYRDPASFGLEPDLVGRLLPDRDLEALPRRAFAFGVLEGMFRGTDLSSLDPADPVDRRILLEADHDHPGGRVSDKHLDKHAALAERLWHGDPPELWDAAQRMLDVGIPRHDVVHALIDALDRAGRDHKAIRRLLRDLPQEPAG